MLYRLKLQLKVFRVTQQKIVCFPPVLAEIFAVALYKFQIKWHDKISTIKNYSDGSYSLFMIYTERITILC